MFSKWIELKKMDQQERLEAVKASVEQVRQLTLQSWPSTHSNPPDIENWRTTIACLIKNCDELQRALRQQRWIDENFASYVLDQCERAKISTRAGHPMDWMALMDSLIVACRDVLDR